AMQFHIGQGQANLVGDMAHQKKLAANLPKQLLQRHNQPKSPKTLWVVIAGMCPGPYTARLAYLEDAPDRGSVAGMSAAGNRSAGDDAQKVVIGSHPLAQVSIEIDTGHARALPKRRCAWSTLTGIKATVSPGLICANRSRSAEITVPIRG